MNGLMEKKGIGFYFVILTMIVAVVSSVRYYTWSSANETFDWIVMIPLLLGIVLDLLLIVKECDYLIVLATASYSVAVVRLLTESVGSFVDAFQGINMFGNAAHVGDITNISIFIGVTIALSIIASFMNRVKR